MLSFDLIVTFPPLILVLNALYLFLFQKYFTPKGALYSSLVTFSAFLIFLGIISTCENLATEFYIIDFGRWFFCANFFDSHLVFIVDFLSLSMGGLVGVLTPLALIFGSEYMYREFHIYRLLLLLNAFAVSVIFFFFVYDFFLLMLTWEGIGLFSLLLVNFYSIRVYTLKAALKTFVLSRLSDLCIFATFTIFTFCFQSTDLTLCFLQIPFFSFHFLFLGGISWHLLSLLATLLSLGGLIKSAQFFFHVWLPDAMEAPTPASALIHSSTLVVAGIFLIFRFALLFEFTPQVNQIIALYGAWTLVFASLTACFQQDIKKLVAYSTISQIGYLVCGCGMLALPETLTYLVIHAINKALLFILVGYLVHLFQGNTDLRFMGGVWVIFFDYGMLLLILGGNLMGLPYFGGFLSKEFLLNQCFLSDDGVVRWVRTSWLISFFLTPFYMMIPWRLAIFSSRRSALVGSEMHDWYSRNRQQLASPYFTSVFGTGLPTLYLYALFLVLIMTWGDFFYLCLHNFYPLHPFSLASGFGNWAPLPPMTPFESIQTGTILLNIMVGAIGCLLINLIWRLGTFLNIYVWVAILLLV